MRIRLTQSSSAEARTELSKRKKEREKELTQSVLENVHKIKLHDKTAASQRIQPRALVLATPDKEEVGEPHEGKSGFFICSGHFHICIFTNLHIIRSSACLHVCIFVYS